MSKICIKCNILKSIDNFPFRNDTKKYRNECKICYQLRINYYKRNNDEYKKLQPLTREDNSIKGDKVWTNYNLMKNPYI